MLEINKIYLKSEPSGEIGLGKITTAELSNIMELGKNNWGRKNYLKNFASESKRFLRFKGIFNTGLDGDIGNIGTIKLVKKKALTPEYAKTDNLIYLSQCVFINSNRFANVFHDFIYIIMLFLLCYT